MELDGPTSLILVVTIVWIVILGAAFLLWKVGMRITRRRKERTSPMLGANGNSRDSVHGS
jgi:predicted permease